MAPSTPRNRRVPGHPWPHHRDHQHEATAGGRGEERRGGAYRGGGPRLSPSALPLQQYQKGVIKATPTTCDPQHLDHSVLLVGFGGGKSVEGRRPGAVSSQSRPRRSSSYWILKNSWGAKWGEEVSVIYCGGQGRTGICHPSGPEVP